MKIAIHFTKDKASFCHRWINYCKLKNIQYIIVDVYNNDIIKNLSDCTHFMWHFLHYSQKDILFAKELLYSIRYLNIKMFPDFNTMWHFDDKLAQSYLFKSINAPMIKTHIFYDQKEALLWINQTSFPKVFKTRNGAGSSNVILVKNKHKARNLIKTSFSKGISSYNKKSVLKERLWIFKNEKNFFSFIRLIKSLYYFILPLSMKKSISFQKNYVYFQHFQPNNACDYRVIVIGDRAFVVKRFVRDNDFRASGSNKKYYPKNNEIDLNILKLAFDLQNKLMSQCTAYDFIYDDKRNPLLVEISYGFSIEFYDPCPGYWDSDLNYHHQKFIPQHWMVEDLINS